MAQFMTLCVITLLANHPRAAGQENIELRGFVRELDAKVGIITVVVPKNGVQAHNLANANIPVRDARENPLKLQDVKPGWKIALSITAAGDVVSIKVFPSFKVGKVVSVNAETREVELLVKKEKLRFKVAKDAHYYRSERVVMPREIRLDDRITVYYLPENNEVIVINYRDLDSGPPLPPS